MKLLIKLSLTFTCSLLATGSNAFPELPFCPAGGPPGWMNHFNYKREQNNWQHYSPYTRPVYYPAAAYREHYTSPYSQTNRRTSPSPYGYSNRPVNQKQSFSRPENSPYLYQR